MRKAVLMDKKSVDKRAVSTDAWMVALKDVQMAASWVASTAEMMVVTKVV